MKQATEVRAAAWKALVWKELRELAPMIALALLALTWSVCSAMGLEFPPTNELNQRMAEIPFVSGLAERSEIPMIGALLGLALGLWQTWWESSRGTFLFLLHRPIERRQVLTVKLLVGGITCLLIVLLPMLVLALWAAAPGTHASPFNWTMTWQSWLVALTVPVIYFAAFLSGLRSARWYGSRFLPIAAAVILLLSPMAGLFTQLTLTVLALLLDVALVWVIFEMARDRDYA